MTSRKDPPPLSHLDAVFLDVGNTLVSIDFGRVSRKLEARDLRVPPEELERAEAASRPSISASLVAVPDDFEGVHVRYLHGILSRVASLSRLGPEGLRALASELTPELYAPGRADRLWCRPLAGAREALARLREHDVRLVAVSNSDGTAEKTLRQAAMRDYFDHVVDSEVVGFEKPDERIFRHALDLSGSAPERTLHVGDFYDADVVGARSVGVHAVLLDPWNDWPELDCPKRPSVAALVDELVRAALA